MDTPKSRWFRFRWVIAASIAVLASATYFATPIVVGLWRAIEQINQATAETSKIIGQPSADWHTTDLEGATRALADYRSKVVVLDFWFSGCGWCLEAMPQMIELAKEFKDQPVVVLGVNSDGDIADAQRVIENLHINYLTIKDSHDGASIHELYNVVAWPTIIVLDQHGVARHVHVGYWPWMRTNLAGKIRELIAED